MEGSPVDRTTLAVFEAAGVLVLLSRRQKVWAVLRSNLPFLAFFLYCGLSTMWSGYPDVSLKRWIGRSMGDVVMVLVILTERDWIGALKLVITRIGFVLVPMSLVLAKFFGTLGRAYSEGGVQAWTGVTTNKNSLGVTCMIFGLGSLWCILEAAKMPKSTRRRRLIRAHGAVVAIALYLVFRCNSVTSTACFFLAGAVMIIASRPSLARQRALIHLSVATALIGCFCVLFLGIGSGLLNTVGRDSSLTGRTAVWDLCISMVDKPLIGTGYESFWLGKRLGRFHEIYSANMNEAHNGYLEIWLNVGWAGVGLLGWMMVTAYTKLTAAVRRLRPGANLALACFVVAGIYNFTEAAFKMMHPVWIFLLLGMMSVRVAATKAHRIPVRTPYAPFGAAARMAQS